MAVVLACASRSGADDDPRWAVGAQAVAATTHFSDGIGTIGPGIRGNALAHLAPHLWVGAEVAAYAWVQPSFEYTEPGPFNRRFQAGSASLVLQAGPQWHYRPYWVLGLSVEQQTASATAVAGPQQVERAPGWAIGLGTRGSHGPFPWLEWRWHQSFRSMAILGGHRLVYHTLGVGVGWN